MSHGKKTTNGQRLADELKEQGRSVTWLAQATGYSRTHIHHVLNGTVELTPRFQDVVAVALQVELTTNDTFRGQLVRIPVNVHRNLAGLTADTKLGIYEDAWKRSWLEEHAEATLAIAADRAWRRASETATHLRPSRPLAVEEDEA